MFSRHGHDSQEGKDEKAAFQMTGEQSYRKTILDVVSGSRLILDWPSPDSSRCLINDGR